MRLSIGEQPVRAQAGTSRRQRFDVVCENTVLVHSAGTQCRAGWTAWRVITRYESVGVVMYNTYIPG